MEKAEENRRNSEVDALIQDNLKLVLKIANDFLNRGLPWDDLVAEGNRGLVTAARRYNPRRGAKFSTYSACWIKQAIRQAISEQIRTVRVPVGTQLNAGKIKRAVRKLSLELKREPTDEEVAAEAKLPLVTVTRLRNKCQADMQSLNEIIGESDGDGVELQEFFCDEKAESPVEKMIRVEDIEHLLALFEQLPPREKQVLRLRFGLDGSPVMTLDQLGKILHCTNERVRQIQNQALRRLGKQMKENE